jgi:DNA-directed RNA polymerase specialized sigma24 family protein
MSQESVTTWISWLKTGEEAAAGAIWDRFYQELIDHARKRLNGMPRRVIDEEDVVLCAMQSAMHGIRDGEYPNVRDRQGLVKLLLAITARKATDAQRCHLAAKRGGGKVRGESAFLPPDGPWGIDGVAAEISPPEMAPMLIDQIWHLLDSLEEDSLREVAILAMEGHTVAEMAERLGCSRRTIERKLRLIRTCWKHAESS